MIHLQVPLQIPCSRSPHVAMGRGLYHHPALAGARRAVSEGSGLAAGLPCGLSAPRDCYRQKAVPEDPRSSPHIARFVPGPYGPGVATRTYDLALLAEPQFERDKDRTLTGAQLGWLDGRCVQGAGAYSPRDVDTRLLRNPSS